MATKKSSTVFASRDGRAALRAATENKNPEERVPGDIPPYRGGYISPVSPSHGGEKKKKLSVDDVVSLAAQLSAADRKELLARLALEVQTRSTDSRDLTMWADAVYQRLHEAIGTSEGTGVGPLPVRRLLAAVANWAPVEKFMQDSRLQSLTVPKRLAVYHMLAGLLVDDAQRVARLAGAPLTVKFVAGRSAHIAAVFDTAFPGYLAAGLAHVVAAQLVQGAS